MLAGRHSTRTKTKELAPLRKLLSLASIQGRVRCTEEQPSGLDTNHQYATGAFESPSSAFLPELHNMHRSPPRRPVSKKSLLFAPADATAFVWSDNSNIKFQADDVRELSYTGAVEHRQGNVSNDDILLESHPNPRTGVMSPYIGKGTTGEALQKLDYFSFDRCSGLPDRYSSTLQPEIRKSNAIRDSNVFETPLSCGLKVGDVRYRAVTRQDEETENTFPLGHYDVNCDDPTTGLSSSDHGINEKLQSLCLAHVSLFSQYIFETLGRLPAIYQILSAPITDPYRTLGALIDLVILTGIAIAAVKGRLLILDLLEHIYVISTTIATFLLFIIGWSFTRSAQTSTGRNSHRSLH